MPGRLYEPGMPKPPSHDLLPRLFVSALAGWAVASCQSEPDPEADVAVEVDAGRAEAADAADAAEAATAPEAASAAEAGGGGGAPAVRDASISSGDAGNDAGEPGSSLDAGGTSKGHSAGCGKAPPSTSSNWAKHDLMVTGVAQRFLPGGTKYGVQQGYDFTHRNYFLRLPTNYDANKPYPLVISAGGCGATNGISGDNGGSNPLPEKQAVALQVGLSYVYPNGAGACFADGSADTPDLPYFDAVLAELDAAYCFDRERVFVSGFSSGAWESYMLSCARAGVIRAIGTQAGGLRKERPPCSNAKIAAFLTAGVNDDNPISNVDSSGFDTGSQAARDVILKTNGCATRDTEPYVSAEAPADWHCLRYTSCPADYPVIWCAITADGGKHGAGSNKAFWPFWSALP
jgi:poly(3-hydroxybutyrate) depolymerase